MAGKPVSRAVAIIEKTVAEYQQKYPEHLGAINEFLRAYRLPDGSLQNDDDIILGLGRMAKAWKRKGGTGGGSVRRERR